MPDRSAQMFSPAARLSASGLLTSLEETEGVKAVGRPNWASRRRPADMPPPQRTGRRRTHTQRAAGSTQRVLVGLGSHVKASELLGQYVISEAHAGRILPQPLPRLFVRSQGDNIADPCTDQIGR